MSVSWNGELKLLAIEQDRVVFYTHPDEEQIVLPIGCRVAVAMVVIDDDETKAVEERTGVSRRARSPSNMAAMLCKDTRFHVWAAQRFHERGFGRLPPSEDTCKRLILNECNIQSRSELDMRDDAYVIYQTMIELPYYRHLIAESAT